MTATIIEDELDFKVFDALDFDASVSCENLRDTGDCPNDPKFRCVLECCWDYFLVCEDCLLFWKEYFRTHPDVHYQCIMCNYEYPKGFDPVKVLGRI